MSNETIQTALADQTPVTVPQTTAGTEIATTRQAQEVQAAMIVARRFPRDVTAAIARITEACQRPLLAGQALYEYSKGGTKICGPSIRLAEAMAQSWGNLDFGVIELSRDDGQSEVCSYCWDLETNTRQQKVFTVKHVRDKRSGNVNITSERDIYEHVANYAARRLRACILGVIPGDVQELAVAQCNKTLIGNSDVPIADRARKMVVKFAPFGVTQEMIEAKLQHPVSSCSPNELARLAAVYTSLKDGVGTREDHFEVAPSVKDGSNVTADDLMGKKLDEPKPTTDAGYDVDEFRDEAVRTLGNAKTLQDVTDYLTAVVTSPEVTDADAKWLETEAELARVIIRSKRGEGSNEQGSLLDTKDE